jgi:hypothetical protein
MQNLNKQHLKDEQIANNWLIDNDITQTLFNKVQVFQLQAYKAATNILKHNVKLLKNTEYEQLKSYCKAMLNSKQRNSLTKRNTYKIFNIGTRINRQLFRQYRKIK